jgi:hypothetical protein
MNLFSHKTPGEAPKEKRSQRKVKKTEVELPIHGSIDSTERNVVPTKAIGSSCFLQLPFTVLRHRE